MISAFTQGINPLMPLWMILIITLLSFFISWWSYSHLASIQPRKKWSMILLRGSALLILILLLLNPFLTRESVTTVQPKIAVYLDNSQSITVERGDYSGIESYLSLLEQFRNQKDLSFEYEYFLFDEMVRPGDEPDGGGSVTNLFQLMEHKRENSTRFSAALLFSDGIVTQGRNPVFAAQTLSSPLITVPLGDTVRVQDLAVAGVNYSQPVFTNTRQTIQVDVQQQGYDGDSTPVQLIRNGELIETKTIEFSVSQSRHQLEFVQEFSEPGFYEFEVNIPVKPGEFTERNNRSSFTLEVLDDKTRILSLAFEVHPDVSSVRRLISGDQQNELISSTKIGSNRFTGTSPQEIDEELDLIVIHGLPQQNSALFSWLMDQTVPLIYFALPGSFSTISSSDYMDLTGLYASQVSNPLDVHIRSLSETLSHPLLEFDPVHFNRLPTVISHRGSYTISPLAQTLLKAEFQRTETEIPILTAEDASVRRLASVNAYGWYRYEQNRSDEVRNFYRQFFNNLISWASTPPDRRNLVVEPRKENFSENEPVEIRATLLNERGEPETEGVIELQLTGGMLDDTLTFLMNHRRNGEYGASIGNYPEGLYRVDASAEKDGRVIGTAETRVNVSRSSQELVNTRRDDAMLEQLAEITGGVFLSDYQFERINTLFAENNLMQERVETDVTHNYFYRSGFWFFVVLLFLSVEWLIRRSVSLP